MLEILLSAKIAISIVKYTFLFALQYLLYTFLHFSIVSLKLEYKAII
jgi:hypothetical protein